MRSDNAVPVLDDTTGSDRPVPRLKHPPSRCFPRGVHPREQLLGPLSQDLPALPSPSNQPHRWCSQLLDGLLLSDFHLLSKVQQGGQRHPPLLDHPLHFVFQGRGPPLVVLLKQPHHRPPSLPPALLP